jgi:hypothetical protein
MIYRMLTYLLRLAFPLFRQNSDPKAPNRSSGWVGEDRT